MADAGLDDLLAVLRRGQSELDEEEVDLLAHGLQCAAILAERFPDDVELQLAGLVHDVGSVLRPGSPRAHAAIGARYVQPLLGERVARLVGAHAAAKRWLVANDPGYRAFLSPVSIRTLAEQTGDLDEQDPDFAAMVELRRADDAAKVPGRDVPPLDAWIPLLTNVCIR